MPRVRIIAPTFLAFGRAPTEKRPNSDKKTFVDVPLPHGRLYEPDEVVEVPDKHSDGRPFVICDEAYCEKLRADGVLIEPTMERIEDEPAAARASARR